MSNAETERFLDGLFQFHIGDVVTLRSMLGATSRLDSPQRLTVLVRYLEQCHGGVQLAYDVRPIASMGLGLGFTTPIRVLDLELVAYPTEPASKATP